MQPFCQRFKKQEKYINVSHKIPYIGEVTAGMERSGKTYYTEKLGNAFNRKGRTIIAYNVGREEDYKD